MGNFSIGLKEIIFLGSQISLFIFLILVRKTWWGTLTVLFVLALVYTIFAHSVQSFICLGISIVLLGLAIYRHIQTSQGKKKGDDGKNPDK